MKEAQQIAGNHKPQPFIVVLSFIVHQRRGECRSVSVLVSLFVRGYLHLMVISEPPAPFIII